MKLTEAQRWEIAKLYAEHGFSIAHELAAKYGIHPHYVITLSNKRGIRRNKRSGNTHRDPRWALAKQRGAIDL